MKFFRWVIRSVILPLASYPIGPPHSFTGRLELGATAEPKSKSVGDESPDCKKESGA
jgi:hypothetical protein